MNQDFREYTRDEWLDLRKRTVGSSDAPIVCGVSDYGSPFESWARKRGVLPDVQASRRMRAGHALEREIEKELELDFTLRDPGDYTVWRHREDKWRTATPDRIALDRETGEPYAVVEFKTRHSRFANEGEPTESMLIQVQHQLDVMELDLGYIAVWYGLGDAFEVYEVAANPELQALVVERERTFWDHLCWGTPPDLDDLPATVAALREIYGHEDPTIEQVQLDATVWHWVQRRQEALKIAAEAKRLRNRAEAEIYSALKDAPSGVVPGVGEISWKTIERKGYTVNPTSYRQLRIKEVDDSDHD